MPHARCSSSRSHGVLNNPHTNNNSEYWTIHPVLWHNLLVDRKGEKRIPRRALQDTRTLAITALQKGMHPDNVADLYDVGRSTVYNWRKEYQEKGPAALTVKKAPGRTPRLTDKQRDRLRKLVGNRFRWPFSV